MHAPTAPIELPGEDAPGAASSRRPRSLARLLALLAGMLLAPALALGIFTAIEQTSRIREGLETALFYAGRAAAAAVATEVETRLFLLGALASSRALENLDSDGAAFRERSRVPLEPFGGRILFLPGAAGEDEPSQEGGVPGGLGLLEQVAENALARGEAAFPLLPQADGSLLPFVVVPVGRPEARLGALGIPIGAARLGEALRLPGLPEGSGILLLGPSGEVIARSADAVLPDLRYWPADQAEALHRARGIGLVPVRVGSARLLLQSETVERTGWTVAVFQPEAAYGASWREPALRHVAGGLAVVAAGLIAAVWFARRLLAGLPGTVAPAARRVTPLRVTEFEAAQRAIRSANAALRREAERAAAVAVENSRLAREAENDRRLLRSVMESAPDPIFVKDRALRYVIVNEATARVMGRPASDILGRSDAELLTPRFAAHLAEQDARVMAVGHSLEFEDRLAEGPEGPPVAFLTTKSPWRKADGALAGVVGISRDITRRREAEAQLRDAEAAMRRLARADSLTVMSVGIAHELNQPLTASANYLGAALRWIERAGGEEKAMGQARAAIAEAAAETQRAGGILRSLRDFIDRGETGQADILLAPLLSETAALLCAARGGEELPIALAFPPEPVMVRADRLQLQQVLVNLLRNAIEATEGQAERGLAVQLSLAGAQARIAVLDRGPGLAPEVRARLFEPFVSTGAHGMGMGLSISRTIVEAQGGRLSVEDRAGGGTAFVVALPLALAAADAAMESQV